MWIVDLQGFDYGRDLMKFTCKEIALINSDNGYYVHRFINLPLDIQVFTSKLQNHINWLTNNVHGLEWNMKGDGCKSINYEDLAGFLKSWILESDIVAVKGPCKKKWLSALIRNEIIDLTDEQYPPLRELKNIFKSFHCNNHFNNKLNCALENIMFLYFWHVQSKQQNKTA